MIFAAEELNLSKKILVAYFSHSGNTREIARQIHAIVGGDIFEIQSVKPYPNDYDAVVNGSTAPAPHPATHNIVYYAETANPNATPELHLGP